MLKTLLMKKVCHLRKFGQECLIWRLVSGQDKCLIILLFTTFFFSLYKKQRKITEKIKDSKLGRGRMQVRICTHLIHHMKKCLNTLSESDIVQTMDYLLLLHCSNKMSFEELFGGFKSWFLPIVDSLTLLYMITSYILQTLRSNLLLYTCWYFMALIFLMVKL